MANSSAGKSRLHWCVTDNPEDWTTLTGATGAGFQDINPDDGDSITGIASLGHSLVIFKNRSTYILDGSNKDNFIFRSLSPTIGCPAPKSIVKADNFVIFLSHNNVYAATRDDMAILSTNIQPDIEAITSAARPEAAAGRYKNQYWMAYDSDADAKNDTAYVLDYVYGIWTQYTVVRAARFLLKDDQTFLSGGSEETIIHQRDSSANDNGGIINFIWTSNDFDLGSLAVDKTVLDLYLSCEAIAGGKTITIEHFIDGVLQADTPTFSLTAVGSNTYAYGKTNMVDTVTGRYIRFRLSNKQLAATVKLYGFNALIYPRERQD
jgi:hypothetical protein